LLRFYWAEAREQLINTLVGRNVVTVGHTLEPCTTLVSSVPWSYRNRKIILVDTPALDEDECPGTTVTLEHLKKQLKKWMKDA
jgi:GTPase Era involved in 16S rRNA processing